MWSSERTLVLSDTPSASAHRETPPHQGCSDEDVIVLEIGAHQLPIPIPKGEQIIVGRYHATNTIQPQVDLTPYGAAAAGCSRHHVAIGHSESGWWIKDLKSSNGTWINEERAAPFVEYRLESVSDVWLAKLEVYILLPRKTLPI